MFTIKRFVHMFISQNSYISKPHNILVSFTTRNLKLFTFDMSLFYYSYIYGLTELVLVSILLLYYLKIILIKINKNSKIKQFY